ncbi:MAG TPA: LuxR C-terminal-related transcriptional regulator, partial [Trebonia sp.]|nr:LuxR C-terminal-related transcriptional regulator [Trebonia sp.]
AISRALPALRDLGDGSGIAHCLEVLGWLAARESRSERAAWLLGAADALWLRTGGRLGNIAIMEQCHQHAAKRAREGLGGLHYEKAHDRGAALDLAMVLAWAVDEGDAAPWPDGGGARREHAFADGDLVGGGNAGALADTGDRSGPAAATPVTALTRREREIALLVASGLSNRDIATRLFISKRTVDAHVEHIFAKLEISSRVKLTMWLQSQARIGA